MKRSYITRKTAPGTLKSSKPRKALRKKSKEPISKIQRRIWLLCKEITRKKYPNACYTCERTGLEASNWQTGHMWAKASVGAYLKYDLRILRPQCSICNLFQGGRGADFYKRMLREIGPEKMAELENDRKKIVNAYTHYQSLIPLYEQELKNLLK